MSPLNRAHAAALAVVLIMAGRVYDAQDRLEVLIRFYEHPAISGDVITRSRVKVETILIRAEVGVVWRQCPSMTVADPVCNAAPEPNEVVVRFVSRLPPIFSPHACGVTLVPTNAGAHFVTLFPACVYESADSLGVPADVVFACTLAHEIGHVFLGPDHSSYGLMQARPRVIDWRRGAHDGLLFTAAESRRLRDALMLRNLER